MSCLQNNPDAYKLHTQYGSTPGDLEYFALKGAEKTARQERKKYLLIVGSIWCACTLPREWW